MIEVKIAVHTPQQLQNLARVIQHLADLEMEAYEKAAASGATTATPTPGPTVTEISATEERPANTDEQLPPEPAKKRGGRKKADAAEANAGAPAEAEAYALNFPDGSLEETFTDLDEWAECMADRMKSCPDLTELKALNTANEGVQVVLMKQRMDLLGKLSALYAELTAALEPATEADSPEPEPEASKTDPAPAEAPAKTYTKEEIQALVREYCNTYGMKASVEKLKEHFGVERVSEMKADDYERAATLFTIPL